ncbi:hypothetical protein [Nitratireductor luteus]|nr:hypothetical protein [Nitratireductor luteus]
MDQAEAKMAFFEHWSGAYVKMREHRSAGKRHLQPGIIQSPKGL